MFFKEFTKEKFRSHISKNRLFNRGDTKLLLYCYNVPKVLPSSYFTTIYFVCYFLHWNLGVRKNTLGRMTCNYKFYVIILAKLRFRKIFAFLYCIDSSTYDSVAEISFPKDYVWIYDDMFKDFWPQFDNDDVAEIFLVFESENFMKIWTNYFFPFISSFHKILLDVSCIWVVFFAKCCSC